VPVFENLKVGRHGIEFGRNEEPLLVIMPCKRLFLVLRLQPNLP
jgi:hypothetical protein